MSGKQAKRLRKYVQEELAPKLPSLSKKQYMRNSGGQIRLVRNTVRAIVQRLKHDGVRVRLNRG